MFIGLPYHLNANLPNWIPPLYADQKAVFNPKKNTLLGHCSYAFFLLFDKGKPVGRIAVYIDHPMNEYRKESIGCFGHYECIDNDRASALLLKTAEDWLKERAIKTFRGPWNFVTQDMGFICEGFDLPPTILSSYNPEYYNEQVLRFGMRKTMDLLVYSCDLASGYRIPERFVSFSDEIVRRYRVQIRPLNMKNLIEEARTIVHITNASLAGNWGFYPVPEAEAETMARDLKMIIHPEVVLFAEIDGLPVGYLLTLPDVNDILKDMNGRLFPFGIFKLLRGIRKINRYRVWAMGILKPYQQKGIAIMMIRHLNEVLAGRGVYIEINWVLENNALMNNALKRLNFSPVKKYRIYEKEIG